MGYRVRRDQEESAVEWLDITLEAEGAERLHLDRIVHGGKAKQIGDGNTREEWETRGGAGAIVEGAMDDYGLTAGRYQWRVFCGLDELGQPKTMPRHRFEVVKDVSSSAETPASLGPVRDLAIEVRQMASDASKRADTAIERLATVMASGLDRQDRLHEREREGVDDRDATIVQLSVQNAVLQVRLEMAAQTQGETALARALAEALPALLPPGVALLGAVVARLLPAPHPIRGLAIQARPQPRPNVVPADPPTPDPGVGPGATSPG